MMPDQDYELFEVASNAFSDDELINRGLSIARNTVNSLLTSLKQPPPVEVRVYGYADQQINAIAMKSDGIYKIALSTATLARFFYWYKMWFQSPDMKALFQNEQDNDDVLIEKFYKYSISYIASHEFFHAMNGHCDIPKNEEHFVAEKSAAYDEEQYLFNQILEFDADRSAVRSNMYLLLKNSAYSGLAKEVNLFSFSMYNVFLVFQIESKANFDDYMEHRIYSKGHPYDGIRFSYSFAFILSLLMQIYPPQVVTDCFGFPIIERVVTFEKQVLRTSEVKNCLFSASYTDQGAQHIMDLNNSWDSIAERLKPYAHVPLAKGEHIPELLIFIDDDGNFYKAAEEKTKADGLTV